MGMAGTGMAGTGMAAIRRLWLIAAVVMLPAAGALAHAGATGVVKERMDLMVEMAGAMKRTLGALRADAPLDGDAVTRDIRLVADHSRDMLHLFPAGSDDPPSESKPAVWQEWDAFRQLAEDSAGKAEALVRAVEFGERDAAMRRFADLGRSCGTCHSRFRASDKKAF